ncbi:fungal fruit body lectin-domain-containing protein [Infundibulicybe gibba]|nr:fungal fruit body lectin-domain-containing protein [Infundibulicybe gibba]
MIPPEMQKLADGNKAFRDRLGPEFFKESAKGQSPPFFYLGCADSRLSEGTLTNADPGILFAQRNIANQFREGDVNALVILWRGIRPTLTYPRRYSALAFGVAALGLEHILVVGHYGCGGVGAAISTPPPPRSTAEIVELRKQSHANMDDLHNPGFRALIEENVKANVRRVATDPILTEYLFGTPPKRVVFVHGLVYDIETGIFHDLEVSVAPHGSPIPESPFASLQTLIGIYEINVRIINASSQRFNIVEKTVWHYANGGQWNELVKGVHTLTMGGSGTSGGLRFVSPSGEIFAVFMGVHNCVRWCDIVPDLEGGNTAVVIHPTYYGGDRGDLLWKQASQMAKVTSKGRKLSIVFAESTPAFYATIFVSD